MLPLSLLWGLRREGLLGAAEVAGRRRRWALALWLGVLLLGAWLGWSEKPWEGAGARHLARGKALRFEDIVAMQLWWAGAWMAAVLGVLGLSSRWWMSWARVGERGAVAGVVEGPQERGRWRRRHRVLLGLVVLVGLAARLPRMERFMERDEQDTVRRSMIGYVPLGPSGKVAGAAVVHPWKLTVWECAQANNPFLFSIAARGSVRAWQAMAGAERWRVSLVALRLPSLLAGMAGLGVLVWLGVLAGRPEVGLLAALLGAVHPLHVEFSTQARGYGMVLLFTPLALACAWQALRRGRWRDWWAVAGSLLGLLMANPGSIYFAASLGVFLTGGLGWRLRGDVAGSARMALSRWGLCAVLAGLAYVPLILPALPQALAFLKTMKGPLHGMWVLMTWAHYGGGFCYPPMEVSTPWLEQGKGAGDFLLGGYVEREPLTAAFLLLVVPWLLGVGLRWWWGQPGFRPLLLAAVAAPLAAYGMHRSADSPFLYHWYLIYWLPAALLLVAAALVRLGGAVPTGIYVALLLYINLPGPGRIQWAGYPATEAQVYLRGRYQWITQPNGVTFRQLLPGRAEKKEEERAGAEGG